MTKRTPAELAAHYKAEALRHSRKAKIAESELLTALESIRKKLVVLKERDLAAVIEKAITDEIMLSETETGAVE